MSNKKLWEPDQSKHGHYCGMQGSHSLGHGKQGSCTCGRDALLVRAVTAEIERNAFDSLAQSEHHWKMKQTARAEIAEAALADTVREFLKAEDFPTDDETVAANVKIRLDRAKEKDNND
jgi:hypothetical protein